MGAWIETVNTAVIVRPYSVASYVGAWIETGFRLFDYSNHGSSHPMWVRGLKQNLKAQYQTAFTVASYVGAWIETVLSINPEVNSKSHPMWVRGLKHKQIVFAYQHYQVASYVGAWIETMIWVLVFLTTFCRILCGCVD